MPSRLLIALAPCLLAPGAMAADSIFVSVAGVQGESTDPSHTGWIDALALDASHGFPWDASIPAPAGTTTFESLAVLKQVDLSTPTLHLFSAIRQQLATVIIDVCRDGPAGQECYLRFELIDCFITSVSNTGSVCIDPAACGFAQNESVKFDFHVIQWTYTPYSNGKAGASVETCYSLTGKGC